MTVRGLRWWMVFGLIGPITFVMSLDRTAIVVAAPTIQHEYGFSLVQMSLILTSFSWTYAALQVPAGWLAQKFGARRALVWANLLWSALTMATPLGFNVASFVGIRAPVGRRTIGRLAGIGDRAETLVPEPGTFQGQFGTAWKPVPWADRRRARDHFGDRLLRLALGVLRLRPARRGIGRCLVDVVP